MNFGQLTDTQCGQTNPLVEMTSHAAQDHALLDTVGMPKSVLEENNHMPPQSFRMNDLISEMNKLESHQDASIEMNRSFTRTTQAKTFQLTTQQPVEAMEPTYSYGQVPQAIYWSHQVGPKGITEGLLEEIHKSESECMGLSTYDKDKYIVIESLEDLKDAQENIERPPQVQPEAQKSFSRLLKLGKEALTNGSIPCAVNYFKLALNVDETSVEGWKLLGIALAENAENSKAIDAFKRGLSLKPRDLEILMALAECYASQENASQTVSSLLDWLVHHPAYGNIIPTNFWEKYPFKRVDVTISNVEVIQNMLIQAARRRPINFDYQVQNALGVLLYVNRDYDRALDCFRAALQVRPRDSRLWNRLGVTLSKFNRHGEAFDAYETALNLDQGFVLSRYNYAMTLMNTKAHREAAKQFLIIANQQERDRSTSNSSQNDLLKVRFNRIWWNLGLCFSFMGRTDLERARKNMDLETLNKEFLL